MRCNVGCYLSVVLVPGTRLYTPPSFRPQLRGPKQPGPFVWQKYGLCEYTKYTKYIDYVLYTIIYNNIYYTI